MSEFVFDGRKAESVENNPDPMTKVTEVYVEPKQEKKLAKRITEKLCVCEREIETIDESTGEVISKVVEKACEGQVYESKNDSFNIVDAVEKRVAARKKVSYLFFLALAVQAAILAYIVFGI